MIIEIDTVYGRISNDKKFLVANYVSETNAMNVTKTECNFILAKRYFGGKLLLRVVAAALLLVYTKNCIFLQTCHCDFAINALLRLFLPFEVRNYNIENFLLRTMLSNNNQEIHLHEGNEIRAPWDL